MKISLKDGFYYIYEFEPEHNHILAIEDQDPMTCVEDT
jgi:zinc finger SWIM domain-containing protein 3